VKKIFTKMADVSQKVFEKKENCRIPATHLAHILAWFCEARIKKIATVSY
jgi:hypothetical protein